MKDIQERVKESQWRDCHTLMEVPMLDQVVLPDAWCRSQPLETGEDVEQQESDMEVIDSEGNEQSATGSVPSDASAESSLSEEVDIEFEMLADEWRLLQLRLLDQRQQLWVIFG